MFVNEITSSDVKLKVPAVAIRNMKLTKMIVKLGANPDYCNPKLCSFYGGTTPVKHIACQNNNVSTNNSDLLFNKHKKYKVLKLRKFHRSSLKLVQPMSNLLSLIPKKRMHY